MEGLQEENEEEIMRKCRKSPPRASMPPRSAINLVRALQSQDVDPDLDGVPLEELDDGVPFMPPTVEEKVKPETPAQTAPKGGFVPSKVTLTVHSRFLITKVQQLVTTLILQFSGKRLTRRK